LGRSETSLEPWIGLDDLLLEIFGGDFVEGAGGDFGGGNAQFFGLADD
jgi:hypothetical protein